MSPFSRNVFRGKSLLLLSVVVVVLLSSCGYNRRAVLFKTKLKVDTEGMPVFRVKTAGAIPDTSYVHLLKPDDILSVRFLNNFDLIQGEMLSTGAGQATVENGYKIGLNGKVNLPVIGRRKLAGMTLADAEEYLEGEYKENIRNPMIELKVLNRTVSVLGEVDKPGIYTLEKDVVSLIEILAAAGGVTQYGKKNQVQIIRGDLKNPEVIIFDLTQLTAISADELIVKDDDIIYVVPRDVKVFSEAISPYTTFLTVLTTLSTVVLIIVNLQRISN